LGLQFDIRYLRGLSAIDVSVKFRNFRWFVLSNTNAFNPLGSWHYWVFFVFICIPISLGVMVLAEKFYGLSVPSTMFDILPILSGGLLPSRNKAPISKWILRGIVYATTVVGMFFILMFLKKIFPELDQSTMTRAFLYLPSVVLSIVAFPLISERELWRDAFQNSITRNKTLIVGGLVLLVCMFSIMCSFLETYNF